MTRRQALAFRLVRHHLVERLGAAGAQHAAVVGLQDTPPGTAALALAARADVAPQALDELVLVPSIRGAPLAVAEEDLAVFTAGLEPPDEAAAKALVGNAWKSLDAITAMDALDRVSEAVHESLRDGPRPRDDFHQALRERLPSELLWSCKGCGSHHVHPSLWRATGIRGVLAIVGREGRSAVFGLPPEAPTLEDPGAELARRFLRAYGPARPKLLADWAGLARPHADALWERAGRLVRVDVDGTQARALAEDAPALADDRGAGGVRLLPNLDPLHAARDRELLVSDPAVRKRIWTAIGGPGTVLISGEVGGLWRPAKKGRTLLITVEPFGKLTPSAKDELAAEAERIAPFRGADTAEVRTATL
ncbi:MAG: DNA glycosylase AlkZ-like family protein [Solirubrobacteraceae bacterium]